MTCTGDAIECSISQAVADEDCRSKQNQADLKGSAEYTLGNQAAHGNDPMAGQLPSSSNPTTVNVPTPSDTGFLGGGSCFSDVSFTVNGASITIPFSSLCQYLIVLRGVIMVVAGLVSFRMMSSTFLQG